jgi:hypothetical protein
MAEIIVIAGKSSFSHLAYVRVSGWILDAGYLTMQYPASAEDPWSNEMEPPFLNDIVCDPNWKKRFNVISISSLNSGSCLLPLNCFFPIWTHTMLFESLHLIAPRVFFRGRILHGKVITVLPLSNGRRSKQLTLGTASGTSQKSILQYQLYIDRISAFQFYRIYQKTLLQYLPNPWVPAPCSDISRCGNSAPTSPPPVFVHPPHHHFPLRGLLIPVSTVAYKTSLSCAHSPKASPVESADSRSVRTPE